MDQSLVLKLESEVSLLVRELQERDRELNSMVLSHQQQLSYWTRDRECLLLLRDQLTRVEERCAATERELRNAQESAERSRRELGAVREEVRRSESQLEREKENVAEVGRELSGVRAENQLLTTSLRSAGNRADELASNEVKLRNALAQALQSSEEIEQEMQDKASYLEEIGVIRGENEQLREETNASREKTLCLSQQLEDSRREVEREKEVSREAEAKLQSSVSTLERKLEVYRTAEERKSQLLASYRGKQERMERELRISREVADRNLSQECKPSMNGLSTPLQVHPTTVLLSPQRPTRDTSPTNPARIRDEPFPPLPSPVSPSLLRPSSLGVIRDEDESDGDITQEVDRVTASFELKLDNILHSIEPPPSPRQLSSLSAIPEEDDTLDTCKPLNN